MIRKKITSSKKLNTPTNSLVEQEIKIPLPVQVSDELQAKLLITNPTQDQVDNIFEQLTDILGLSGEFEFMEKRKYYIADEYLDDKSLTFYRNHVSCRIRRVGEKMELTIKTPNGFFPSGLQRNESSHIITEDCYEKLIDFGFDSRLQEVLSQLDITKISPLLENINNRIAMNMTSGEESYELVLDTFTFKASNGKRSSGPFQEIEIEAKNDKAREKLGEIGRNLKKTLNLEFTTKSKYELGVEKLRIYTNQIKILTNLRALGSGWWGVIIAILSMLIAALGFIFK